MIGINKIVNVNFEIEKTQKPITSYNTTVFITNEVLNDSLNEVICESVDDVKKFTSSSNLISDATLYFENGGHKLLIERSELIGSEGTPDEAVKIFKQVIERAKSYLNSLNEDDINKDDNRFVWVTIDNNLIGESKLTLISLKAIIDYVEDLPAPYSLRLALTTNKQDFVKQEGFDITKNSVAVKYTRYDSKSSNNKKSLFNEALMICAYYSKIVLTEVETIKDYCYTEEVNSVSGNRGINDITDDEYEKLKDNYNFVDILGNRVLNFGGNLSNGISISVDFAAICAENDVTNGVTNVISTKQYLTDAGLNNIVSEINQQLQKYKTNGFLNVGSRYTGDTISITYNGRLYTVIENKTQLSQGFYIFTIPMAFISATDKKEKRFTPIYVIMETQAGARVVTINGKIRA